VKAGKVSGTGEKKEGGGKDGCKPALSASVKKTNRGQAPYRRVKGVLTNRRAQKNHSNVLHLGRGGAKSHTRTI